MVQTDPWRSVMQQVLHLFTTHQPLDQLQLKTSLIPSRTLVYGRLMRNYVDEFLQWPKNHNDLVSIDPVQADMIAMEILSMALDPRFDSTLAQLFEDLRIASKMAMPDLPENFDQR